MRNDARILGARRQQSGFTLIELIITIVLIAAALAAVGLAIYNHNNTVKAETTIQNMGDLDTAVVGWEAGRDPTTFANVTCDILTSEGKVPFATAASTTCPADNWGGVFTITDGNPSTVTEITITASGISNTKACTLINDELQKASNIDAAASGCAAGTATAGYFR